MPFDVSVGAPLREPEVIKLTELCNNKKTLPLRITVLCYTNSGKHATYGRIVTSVREIEMSDRELPLISLRGKPAGILRLDSESVPLQARHEAFTIIISAEWLAHRYYSGY